MTQGAFDPQLRPEAWFDPELIAEGWFDRDLIDAALSGGDASAVAAAGAATVSAEGASVAETTATAAAGVASVSGVGSSVAGSDASAVPADGLATVSGAGASVSAASAVPAEGIASVSGVGSDGSTAFGGGGYDDKPKKRKFIQKVGDKIVVFESATAAINSIVAPKAEPVVISAQKKPPEDAVTVEAVELPQLKATAKAFGHEQQLMAMLRAQQYLEMLELHRALQAQQDEEDIELLALWA